MASESISMNECNNEKINNDVDAHTAKKNTVKEECVELRNMKYKSMLLKKTNTKQLTKCNSNVDIDSFLEKERTQNKEDQWAKLDKSMKISKITTFVESYSSENNLNEKDKKFLHDFLLYCLDQKKFTKTKDVVYDKSTGLIKSIPCLLFNIGQRKFTLKRTEKRQTTMRVVGAKRVAANKTSDHKSSKPTSRSNSATHSRNTSNHNSDDEGVTLVVTSK
jgi:hypothetical protein